MNDKDNPPFKAGDKIEPIRWPDGQTRTVLGVVYWNAKWHVTYVTGKNANPSVAPADKFRIAKYVPKVGDVVTWHGSSAKWIVTAVEQEEEANEPRVILRSPGKNPALVRPCNLELAE